VYAGADGNVYKHTDSGWQKYDNGGWNNVQKPTQTTQRPAGTTATRAPATGGGGRLDSTSYNQLEQDRQARGLGTAQRQGGWAGRGGGGYGGERAGGWRR
jgi:hypothetical protein